jgi:hypothetical protein
MRPEYDFSNARPNRFAKQFKKEGARVLFAAIFLGATLTATPILWHDSQFALFFGRPGMALSTLLGTNDKWGLPALTPYIIGGVLSWSLISYAVVIGLVAFVKWLRHTTKPN